MDSFIRRKPPYIQKDFFIASLPDKIKMCRDRLIGKFLLPKVLKQLLQLMIFQCFPFQATMDTKGLNLSKLQWATFHIGPKN